MPKKDVDYSNTIIYKICCKDESVTDVYVGHTTNFIQRKYSHKIACNNLNNDLKIYNVIRCNGGWDNWNMVELAKYYCKDSTEARIKEQQHYNELKASLNSCPPYVDIKQYFSSDCNLQCMTPKQYKLHMTCNKHIKKPNMNPTTKSSELFVCECCNYSTSRKSQYQRHLATDKHKFLQNPTSKKFQTDKSYICDCGKTYKHSSTLYSHKKNVI